MLWSRTGQLGPVDAIDKKGLVRGVPRGSTLSIPLERWVVGIFGAGKMGTEAFSDITHHSRPLTVSPCLQRTGIPFGACELVLYSR